MTFKLFKKYCPICSKEVNKENALVRFGEHLCSEEHAEAYRQKLAKEKSRAAKSGGGCCG